MHVTHGKLRSVIALPMLGIAIKYPTLPSIGHILAVLTEDIRVVLETAFQRRTENLVFPFTTAIFANWHEYTFYKRTRNPFLHPTLFSLLGIINVQPLAVPLSRDAGKHIYEALWALTTRDRTRKLLSLDVHHFFHGENFCTDQGMLRILDYSSKATQLVIRDLGDRLLNVKIE